MNKYIQLLLSELKKIAKRQKTRFSELKKIAKAIHAIKQ